MPHSNNRLDSPSQKVEDNELRRTIPTLRLTPVVWAVLLRLEWGTWYHHEEEFLEALTLLMEKNIVNGA